MADFNPDQYLAAPFNPDSYLAQKPPAQADDSFLSHVYNTTANAVSSTGHYLNPFSQERKDAMLRGDVLGPQLDTGKGILSALSVPFSPVQGAAEYAVGKPLAAMMPTATPEEQQKLKAAGASDNIIPAANPAENFERAKQGVDTALMGLGARGGIKPSPISVPPRPTPNGPLGVTLSEGQATSELPLIQKEQAALRGQLGDAAQGRAKEFANQQSGEVQNAGDTVAKGLDPFGQVVADTPQEAGQLASQGIQNAASNAKAGVRQAYDFAKNQPGEIHAGAFEGIGPKIKTELSAGDDPIIIDDKLTPFASRAIQDVENRISNLQIQNRADPFGQPNPENITGINLKGVDQMRRRLSAFRSDAFASGNAADGRAAQAVIKAFDNHVDNAVNGGLFNGDPMAVEAWNDARAAHADYKRTFSAGKNDPTGRVVEKILGKGNNPAAIPNDVADFMYGGSGLNPSSLNVNVAKRIKGILGEESPEWSAVKQGLFQRIVDSGPGVTDFGPGKVAQRVNKFLNVDGLELSKEVFSPQERALIQQYGDLHRQLQVPQAGANWSGTGTALAPILKKISGSVAGLIGAAIGHVVAPGLGGIAEGASALGASKLSGAVSSMKEMRQIRQQMPLVSESLKNWQKAAAKVNRLNSPPSQKALNLASANLARSLQNIGINPMSMAVGNAQQQQQ